MAVRPEQAWVTKAKAVSGIASTFSGRIYPSMAPQDGPFPVAIYRVQDEPVVYLTGSSGVTKATLTVGIVAKEFPDAQEAAEALRDGLHLFRGTVTVQGSPVSVDCFFLDSQEDTTQPPDGGGSVPLFEITQTWSAVIRQAA
jgi:hypothetical protein